MQAHGRCEEEVKKKNTLGSTSIIIDERKNYKSRRIAYKTYQIKGKRYLHNRRMTGTAFFLLKSSIRVALCTNAALKLFILFNYTYTCFYADVAEIWWV